MSRPTLLFEAQRRSSRTADPEVCLPEFHWKGLTWSNAKTPTGSGSDSSLSLHLSQLVGHGLHVWVFLIHRFYSRDVRASGILNGDVEPPHECSDLYHILEEYTEAYTADWTSKNMRAKVTEDIMEINSCGPGDNWCSVLFCPSSLLVLHPDLQLLLSREHQPATSHQQRTVTVMPF